MERKTCGGRGGDQYMKRSPSEIALQEVINNTTTTTITAANTAVSTPTGRVSNCYDVDCVKNERAGEMMAAPALRDAAGFNDDATIASELDSFLGDFCSDDINFAFKTLDILQGFTSCGGISDSLIWSQSHNMNIRESRVSAPQSSIYVGSPASANNQPKVRENQIRVTTSGSSPEQTDDEDDETDNGPCEQSTNPTDLKRIRRKVSNRESARRSRRRKLAHLAELEIQVDQLAGENQSLYKQLLDASQHFREADTNNRVLKSDVEALRAKVKLAEDMVARGSLTCSLNVLIQNHLLNAPQHLSGHNNLRRAANVSPSITVRADDASQAPGMSVSGQNPTGFGFGSAGIVDNTVDAMSETVSCVFEMWH